ncbi:MAG TPA: YtxH domain-containing protein [Candidatus Acidoferrales bacterium]|nr:YtxH domain-containing protein [Candidatus Acidoferrales bacterium]
MSFLFTFLREKTEKRLTESEREGFMSGRMKWAGSVSVFAVGLGIGAALGLLFAPAPGDDTRDYILASANDGLDRAVAAGQKVTRRAKAGIAEAKGRVRQAKETGEQAYREAKNSQL